jgi:transcriptional regulator with XRE-family HTH domain
VDRLANRLTRFRKEKKLTQEALAKIVGVSRPTMVNYENGKRKPDYEILQRIADALDVSIDMLLGREENEVMNKMKNDVPLDEIAKEHEISWKGQIMNQEEKEQMLLFVDTLLKMKKIKKD